MFALFVFSMSYWLINNVEIKVTLNNMGSNTTSATFKNQSLQQLLCSVCSSNCGIFDTSLKYDTNKSFYLFP